MTGSLNLEPCAVCSSSCNEGLVEEFLTLVAIVLDHLLHWCILFLSYIQRCKVIVQCKQCKMSERKARWLRASDLADDYVIQSSVKLKSQLPLPFKVGHGCTPASPQALDNVSAAAHSMRMTKKASASWFYKQHVIILSCKLSL